jgi:DNA-binding MarR family transcriptional regulator
MPTNLHEMLGDLVAVNHRVTRMAAQAAHDSESPAVWRTLSVLRQSGPIRLGDLAVRSRVSQPTATKLVTHLAERGWAGRLADPLDARASRTAITPSGQAALAAWRHQLATALLPLFADLPDADVDALERAIAILRERMDAVESGAAS